MLNSRKKWINNLLILFSFVVISLLGGKLLLDSHTVIGAWDLQFHLRRIFEIKAAYQHGDLLPFFNFNYAHGMTMTLYPYLNLVPEVLLSFLIKSKVTLIYAAFIFNLFWALVIAYYSSYGTYRRFSTSYLFALTYSLSFQFLAYNFVNFDLGEVTSYAVMPIAIFGFLDILRHRSNWLKLSFGMTCLILSHLLSALVVAMFLAIWLLVNYRVITFKSIADLIKAALTTVISTAIFWYPAIVMGLNNHFNWPGADQLKGWNWLTFRQILRFPDYKNLSVFAVLAILISVPVFFKLPRSIKQMDVISCLIMVGTCSLVPWPLISSQIPWLTHFQYLWRLFIIPQILLSFVFAYVVTKYLNDRYLWLWLPLICVCLIGFQTYGQFELVNQNLNVNRHVPLTKAFIRKNPVMNLTHLPPYDLQNSTEVMNLVDWPSHKNDYFPAQAKPYFWKVVTNQTMNPRSQLNRIGYNQFSFKSKVNSKRTILPLLIYHHENVDLWLNHHRVHRLINQRGLIGVRNVSRGVNQIKIENHPAVRTVALITLSVALSALIYVFELIRAFKVNKKGR